MIPDDVFPIFVDKNVFPNSSDTAADAEKIFV
jgi:hypothetical protein